MVNTLWPPQQATSLSAHSILGCQVLGLKISNQIPTVADESLKKAPEIGVRVRMTIHRRLDFAGPLISRINFWTPVFHLSIEAVRRASED